MDGVVGIYSPGDDHIVQKVYDATCALQHRGKASAGLAVGNGRGIGLNRGLGRPQGVVDAEMRQTFQRLDPTAAIGNVGYTKNPVPEKRNAEPIRVIPKNDSPIEVTLTMDGYVVDVGGIVEELEPDYDLVAWNKTEIVGALLHKYMKEGGINLEAGRRLVDRLHGQATFALTALVHDGKETRLVALNDDRAFEPFCFGTIDDAFVVSSESCAHRQLGGYIEREFEGAEMVIYSSNGLEQERLRKEDMSRNDFEGVYFEAPNSIFAGQEVYQIRNQLGMALVEQYGAPEGYRVIPNPESGRGVTDGIFWGITENLLKEPGREIMRAMEKGEEMDQEKLRTVLNRLQDEDLTMVYSALIKLAQAARTFSEGQVSTRKEEVRHKFAAIDSLLLGKRVIEGDDSTVKGSVGQGGAVGWLYKCGAEEVQRWTSYPPMFFPSFKEWHRGIACLEELAVQRAFKGQNPYNKTVEEINEAVALMMAKGLIEKGILKPGEEGRLKYRYNTPEVIKRVLGQCASQALDCSYPISEKFWPRFMRKARDEFERHRAA